MTPTAGPRNPFRFLCLGLAALGCTSNTNKPDLAGLYNKEARFHGPARNPIVLIPGILGSKLKNSSTGRVVWGAFGGEYADPATPEGARLVALPMRQGAALSELTDSAVPAGALDRVKLTVLGLPIELNAYLNIMLSLGVGGYRDETLGRAGVVDFGSDHYTCFQFDYDWRRDNVENARRLHEFLLAKRAYVQSEHEKRFGIKNASVKFDVVAHSMGGLLLRYYLRYGSTDLPSDGSAPKVTWAGAELVDRAILVGTPNAGSVQALVALVEGEKYLPFTSVYPPAVLGTMPSIYELLPRGRHGPAVRAGAARERVPDLHDIALWEQMNWGLLDPKQDEVLEKLLPAVSDRDARRRIARDHVNKCLERARRFSAALDSTARPPAGLDLYLVAGDSVPTKATVAVNADDGSLEVVETAPGDGLVLRTSALMDERVGGEWSPRLASPIAWTQVTFLFADHLGLTRDPTFTDNVLYLLLEAPR